MSFFIHPLMGRVWALCISCAELPTDTRQGLGPLVRGNHPPCLREVAHPDHASQPSPLAPSGWPPCHRVPRSVVTPKPFSQISFLGEGNVQMHHFQLERETERELVTNFL